MGAPLCLGDPATMTAELAQQLKEDCLEDLKQRLIDMANLIQGRFEKVGVVALNALFETRRTHHYRLGWYDQILFVLCNV